MKSSGPWLLRQLKVTAHATDFEDAYAIFSLYIRHDEITAEASLSIRHTVQLENSKALQSLTLIIRPENISHCELSLNNHGLVLSSCILDLIPDNAVKTAADVLTLDLALKTPGRVLCPLTSPPIRPHQHDDHAFLAFSRLCTATRIRIYLGKNQVSSDRQARLQTFARHITERKLRAHEIDLRRFGGGEGVQESDWNDIYPPRSLAPPPYQQSVLHHVSANGTSTARNRSRNDPSSPAASERPSAKRPLANTPPPWSPTEANTPSTRGPSTPSPRGDSSTSTTRKRPRNGSRSPAASEHPSTKEPLADTPPPWSPTEANTPSTQSTGTPSSRGDMRSNIQPTKFTKKSASPVDLVHVLSETFKKLPQELVESASRAAFGNLNRPTCVDVDLDASQIQTGLASHAQEVRSVVEAYLRPVVRAELTSLLDQKLDEKLDRSLEQLVGEKLPVLADAVLDDNMDKFLANVDDGHVQARVALREDMDDGIVEMHQARDEGIKDVEAAVQEGIDDLSDHVQVVVDTLRIIESTTSQLKGELQTLLVQQRRLKKRQELLHSNRPLKSVTRRGSF